MSTFDPQARNERLKVSEMPSIFRFAGLVPRKLKLIISISLKIYYFFYFFFRLITVLSVYVKRLSVISVGASRVNVYTPAQYTPREKSNPSRDSPSKNTIDHRAFTLTLS